MIAYASVVRAGIREDDPQNVRVSYVLHGKEHISEIAPPGTPHGPLLDRLLNSLNVPVEAIRAYRGADLLEERKLEHAVSTVVPQPMIKTADSG